MYPTSNQPEPQKEPRLTPAQAWSISVSGLMTAGVLAWPTGDLIYKGHFSTPDFWWVLLLVSLAGWITFIVTTGQARITRQLNDRFDDVKEDLVNVIKEYGDHREADGHSVAIRIRGNGHGPVRQLNPVE